MHFIPDSSSFNVFDEKWICPDPKNSLFPSSPRCVEPRALLTGLSTRPGADISIWTPHGRYFPHWIVKELQKVAGRSWEETAVSFRTETLHFFFLCRKRFFGFGLIKCQVLLDCGALCLHSGLLFFALFVPVGVVWSILLGFWFLQTKTGQKPHSNWSKTWTETRLKLD